MLWTIWGVVAVVVGWVYGGFVTNGLIHVLLVAAVIVLALNLFPTPKFGLGGMNK